jgi:hypothetical protein
MVHCVVAKAVPPCCLSLPAINDPRLHSIYCACTWPVMTALVTAPVAWLPGGCLGVLGFDLGRHLSRPAEHGVQLGVVVPTVVSAGGGARRGQVAVGALLARTHSWQGGESEVRFAAKRKLRFAPTGAKPFCL